MTHQLAVGSSALAASAWIPAAAVPSAKDRPFTRETRPRPPIGLVDFLGPKNGLQNPIMESEPPMQLQLLGRNKRFGHSTRPHNVHSGFRFTSEMHRNSRASASPYFGLGLCQGAPLAAQVTGHEYRAGKSIEGRHVLSVFPAIGRHVSACAGAARLYFLVAPSR
jgi:hypothetical protein